MMIKLGGRRCLVVGGGDVAERKVTALLECGARVTVVSPELNDGLQQAAQARQVGVLRRAFRPSDLDGMLLAIAATILAILLTIIYR